MGNGDFWAALNDVTGRLGGVAARLDTLQPLLHSMHEKSEDVLERLVKIEARLETHGTQIKAARRDQTKLRNAFEEASEAIERVERRTFLQWLQHWKKDILGWAILLAVFSGASSNSFVEEVQKRVFSVSNEEATSSE
jgi:hypothetical protein